MKTDYFKHKAEGYEAANHRVDNVQNIANAVLSGIEFKPDMHIMDFGSGTGLLLEQIAPSVKAISAVDISRSMNEQLEKKRAHLDCELEIIELDLSSSALHRKFDGIISSMTMHHVLDIRSMLAKFHSMLNQDGFIAVADLDCEDGSFHTEDTGVFHFGFDRQELMTIAEETGFQKVSTTTASTAHMPHGDYPVFLLTAFR